VGELDRRSPFLNVGKLEVRSLLITIGIIIKLIAFYESITHNKLMTITINLRPEIETQLTEKATKQGKDISEIVTEIITRAMELELQDYQETMKSITQGLKDFEVGNFPSCEDFTQITKTNGQKMAEALKKISKNKAFAEINPQKWQQEIRQDRYLPNRD
jgi:predicted transcriptional regulator